MHRINHNPYTYIPHFVVQLTKWLLQLKTDQWKLKLTNIYLRYLSFLKSKRILYLDFSKSQLNILSDFYELKFVQLTFLYFNSFGGDSGADHVALDVLEFSM